MIELLPSLRIAHLLAQKGDYFEARLSAEKAIQEALLLEDHLQWLEATRIFFQCCQELEDPETAESAIDDIVRFLASNPDEMLQAQAETLIGSWYLSKKQPAECQAYIHSALTKATLTRDLNTLARALLLLAYTYTLDKNTYGPALQALDKVDVLLAEVENPEVQLSSLILRAYIFTQKQAYKEAVDILWRSYEKAKLSGFYPHISSILAQLARVYRDQKHEEQFQLYAELALKGTDKVKMPRLYKMISEICPMGLESLRPQNDFEIDESSRVVKERSKGNIDFKNQHILYELALLFIKNPGHRFSKEDLVELIWKQVYDPELHDNLIYVSIKRLRTLIEPDLESPRYLLRDRKGYYLNPQTIIQHKQAEGTL